MHPSWGWGAFGLTAFHLINSLIKFFDKLTNLTIFIGLEELGNCFLYIGTKVVLVNGICILAIMSFCFYYRNVKSRTYQCWDEDNG